MSTPTEIIEFSANCPADLGQKDVNMTRTDSKSSTQGARGRFCIVRDPNDIMSRMSEMSHAMHDFCNENYGPEDIPHPSSGADCQPAVIDFDDGEISVRLDGKELRGWSYKDDTERRTKMLCAREYVEGWCDGRDFFEFRHPGKRPE